MKGLFLIVDEREGWASYWHLDPVLPLSSKGRASTECTVKVSTKLFIFQGVILKLNHVLKMHVLLYAAPSEELLMFPSLRTLTFLSVSSTSQRGAGWYKLQQQFSGVMHAVVSEKFGKLASGAPVLFSFPKAKMVLVAIEPGPAKETSNSRSSYVSLHHFQAPRYRCQWCLRSSASIREGKLAELGWGGQKWEGNLCALLPLAPGDSLGLQ